MWSDDDDKMLDIIKDPVPGSNAMFGWDGINIHISTTNNDEDRQWVIVNKLKFHPARMVRIGRMLTNAGAYD